MQTAAQPDGSSTATRSAPKTSTNGVRGNGKKGKNHFLEEMKRYDLNKDVYLVGLLSGDYRCRFPEGVDSPEQREIFCAAGRTHITKRYDYQHGVAHLTAMYRNREPARNPQQPISGPSGVRGTLEARLKELGISSDDREQLSVGSSSAA